MKQFKAGKKSRFRSFPSEYYHFFSCALNFSLKKQKQKSHNFFFIFWHIKKNVFHQILSFIIKKYVIKIFLSSKNFLFSLFSLFSHQIFFSIIFIKKVLSYDNKCHIKCVIWFYLDYVNVLLKDKSVSIRCHATVTPSGWG